MRPLQVTKSEASQRSQKKEVVVVKTERMLRLSKTKPRNLARQNEMLRLSLVTLRSMLRIWFRRKTLTGKTKFKRLSRIDALSRLSMLIGLVRSL